MKKISQVFTILFIMQAAYSIADEGKCKTITTKPGGVYTIKAALYKGTHIQLPERLLFPPQAGDSELWTIEGTGHHIMVQPNSAESQGAKTNLTLITESNTAYHFELKRVPFNQAYSCVVLQASKKFFDESDTQQGFRGDYQTPDEVEQKALQRQIMELRQQLSKERELSTKRIDGVIAKYRSMIYTRYKWSVGFGFKGSELITDVWDDGRFTFLRTKADHRGLMAAKAEVDGKEEMIEYKTDSDYVYKIAGIYPKITLVYGEKNKVTVERRDNKSNGVY